MTSSELWVLEWSQDENGFQTRLLDDSLSQNRQMYRDNTPPDNDYRPLFVGTRQECEAAADCALFTLQEREICNGCTA